MCTVYYIVIIGKFCVGSFPHWLLTCMKAPGPGHPMKIQSTLLDSDSSGRKCGLLYNLRSLVAVSD